MQWTEDRALGGDILSLFGSLILHVLTRGSEYIEYIFEKELAMSKKRFAEISILYRVVRNADHQALSNTPATLKRIKIV